MKNLAWVNRNRIQKILKFAAGSRVTSSQDGCIHVAARFPACQ
jgi:hypothetical protein